MKEYILSEKYGDLNLPQPFYDKVELFAQMLLKYNKIHNITGAKDIKSVYENVYDSVYPLKFLKKEPKNGVDIGSGAGFPALILAFAMPKCNFTLYEPIAKKSAFLHMVKSKMELSSIEIKTKRIEHDEASIAELITSRAVCDTSLLIQLSKGFYDEKSTMILYKGQRAEKEISTLKNVIIFARQKRKYIIIEGADIV